MISELFGKQSQPFALKEKNPYLSKKIYERVCSCKENYLGETKRNVVTRWNEHENPNKKSEKPSISFNNLIMFVNRKF